MKKRGFLNLCIVAAALSVTAGTLYSCKDYDDEMYAELNKHDSTLGDKIAAQEQSLSDLKDKLEQMEQDYATKAEVEVLRDAIAVLDSVLNNKEDGIVGRVIALETAQKEVEALLGAIGERVDAIENKLSIFGTADDIRDLIKDVAETKAKAEANKALANANAEKIAGLEERVKANENAIQKLNEKQAELEKTLKDELAKVNATIDTRISEVQKAMQEVEGRLQKQINDLKTDVSALQDDVNNLKNDLEKLGLKFENALSNLITSVVSNGAYSPVVGYFSLPIGLKSNILAAYYGRAENDVYFPTTSTVNYIKPAQAFTAVEKELLGFNEDKPQYVGGQTVLNPSEDNAGKLYVTFNPNSVNMEGKTFALVNTVGENAGMTLGTPVKSNDRLAFGYSRAGKNNGFYEIPAKLTESQIEKAKLRLEFDDLKVAIKDVATLGNGVNVTNVVSTIFRCINDIADANAVEATWTDSLGEHSVYSDYAYAAVAVKPLSYNSLIDMNRTKFWGIDKAYALVDKVIGRLRDYAANNKPNFNFNLTAPEIDKIKLVELTEDDLGKFVVEMNPSLSGVIDASNVFVVGTNKLENINQLLKVVEENGKKYLEITRDFDARVYASASAKDELVKLTINAQKIEIIGHNVMLSRDANGEVICTLDNAQTKCSATAYVDMKDAVKDIIGDINGSITDANDKLAALQQYVSDVDNLLKDLKDYQDKVNSNIDEAINSLESKLNGFVSKVNNKLCKLVNSINASLQPVVFAKGIGNFVMISGAQTAPSEFPANFVLVPSSYTAEFLAPATKKFVAVTNVFKGAASAQAKDAECVAALKDANNGNEQLNVVLPGNTYDVAVKGLKSGYTYEFTYSALDFYGKIANTKCYIAVK